MDIDNFFYILLAIAIGIVNAIVQSKKKKAKAAQAPARPPGYIPYAQDESLVDSPTDMEVEHKKHSGNIFEELANALSDHKHYMEMFDGTSTTQEPSGLIEESQTETIYTAGSDQLEPNDLHMPQASAYQPVTRFDRVGEDSLDSFSFDDDAISKSGLDLVSEGEIGKAEEENAAQLLLQRPLEFNLREAIIYSEIITPKYFSVRNYLHLNC